MEWIYKSNKDNSARFILGTAGTKPLICIGVNPSTATPNNLDNTLKSVERIAYKNGYDSFIMINLYPQRATNPNDMHKDCCINLNQKNIETIKVLFSSLDEIHIWAAWGTLIYKRKYLFKCLNDIFDISQSYNTKWLSFGKISKKGHPHHPLYLSNDVAPAEFDISNYLNSKIIKAKRDKYSSNTLENNKLLEPKYSFPPLVNSNSTILILGSLPGQISLDKKQYYAHPQNIFWKIMFEILGYEFSDDYNTRCNMLLDNGIALWDMIHSGSRESSLDANIKNEVPNDIEGFLKENSNISKILLNGKKAEKTYTKYFSNIEIEYIVVPSTSPANARMTFAQKLDIWKAAITNNT